MEKKMYSLPLGVQNYLPQECCNKNMLENVLMKEFSAWGYDRIETAPLEFYDNFSAGCFKIDGKTMLKFSDLDGNLVVLTPDITMPIVKLATRMQGDVFRFCYGENVTYNNSDVHTNSRVEFQAGVELIGVDSVDADIEVLALSIEALKKCGLKDFVVDIGNVNYFKGLTAEYGIDASAIRETFDRKNLLGVNMQLSEMGISGEAFEKLSMVMSLFGGEEVLLKAEKMCHGDMSREAVAVLKKVYDELSAYGFSDCLSIDVGLVPRLNYYSGIVFRGLTSHLGAPVMLGGRYDNLGDAFGKELPATGFAIDVKKLLIALEGQGDLKSAPKSDVAMMGRGLEVFRLAERLRGEGLRVEQAYSNDEAQLKKYLKSRNIARGMIVADGKIKEVTP